MSALNFTLWWGVRDFALWWDTRVLFAFLGLTLGVTVRRRVVQRAPFRYNRSFLLTVCAVVLDMPELLAVAALHLSWFPGGCQFGYSTCNLVNVAWPRESVDV